MKYFVIITIAIMLSAATVFGGNTSEKPKVSVVYHNETHELSISDAPYSIFYIYDTNETFILSSFTDNNEAVFSLPDLERGTYVIKILVDDYLFEREITML